MHYFTKKKNHECGFSLEVMNICAPFKPRAQQECHSYVGLSPGVQPPGQSSLAQEQPQFIFKNHKEEIINKVINYNPPHAKKPHHMPISVAFPQVLS